MHYLCDNFNPPLLLAIGFYTQTILIIIELKTEHVKTSPVCWSTHSQQESQIHGNCFLKLKQRWRTLWITVNITKTETSYLISGLLWFDLKHVRIQAMEHLLRQRFLFYKVFIFLKPNLQ